MVEAIPGGKWHVSTLVQAIALDGTRAAMVLDGPMNSVCFTGFCEWLLTPSLRPGDMVVMDNLSSHRSAAAVQAIEAAGARVIYLPPYSPDLNPEELCNGAVKRELLNAAPDSVDALLHQTRRSFIRLGRRRELLHGFFRHVGLDVT